MASSPWSSPLRFFTVALVYLAHFAALFLRLPALVADALYQPHQLLALVALQGGLVVDAQRGRVALGAQILPDGWYLPDERLGLLLGHGRAHEHTAVHRRVYPLRFEHRLQCVVLPGGVRGFPLQRPHLYHPAHAAAAVDHKVPWLKHFWQPPLSARRRLFCRYPRQDGAFRRIPSVFSWFYYTTFWHKSVVKNSRAAVKKMGRVPGKTHKKAPSPVS